MAATSGRNVLAQWVDELVVITVPEEIDVTNSVRLKETLLEAIARRPAVVVVHMTATTFCDSGGMHAIVSAYRQAAAAGAELRLAMGPAGPRRIFELSGVDTVIDVYPDLSAALSA